MVLAGIGYLVVTLLIMAGCAPWNGSFGRIEESREINRQFGEANPFPAGYRWYYTGSSAYPKVLMGISSKYRLESSSWKPVNTDETSVAGMVALVDNSNRHYKFPNFGARIDGPGGELIGVWYSPTKRSTVVVEMDGTLKISIPKEPEERESIFMSL